MLQSNLSGEKKSKQVINKSVIYVDKYSGKINYLGGIERSELHGEFSVNLCVLFTFVVFTL